MIGDWQQLVALTCVVVAVVALARRARRLWKKEPGSGCASGCSSCSEPAATLGASTKPLVMLDLHRPGSQQPIQD